MSITSGKQLVNKSSGGICDLLERQSLIGGSQHGFAQGQAWLEITNILKKSVLMRSHVYASLEIKGFFWGGEMDAKLTWL